MCIGIGICACIGILHCAQTIGIGMRVGMDIGLCLGMCLDMCTHMCVDTYIGMCIGMYIEVFIGMCIGLDALALAHNMRAVCVYRHLYRYAQHTSTDMHAGISIDFGVHWCDTNIGLPQRIEHVYGHVHIRMCTDAGISMCMGVHTGNVYRQPIDMHIGVHSTMASACVSHSP